MPFLDIQIIRQNKTSTTSVYRKPTFSRVYTHFDSFLFAGVTFLTKFLFWDVQLYKEETPARVFICEFCEIFKKTFFAEHLWTTVFR